MRRSLRWWISLVAVISIGVGTAGPALADHDVGRIAFVSTRDGDQAIFAMNGDGSGPVRLTEGGAFDTNPVWSPNGTKIAFQRDTELHIMNPDGSDLELLAGGSARAPAWSPDGTHLAFVRDVEGGADNDVFVIELATGTVTDITDDARVESAPSWAPGGGRLAFTASTDGGAGDVVIARADGSAVTTLVTPADEDVAVWSPTDDRIAVVADGVVSVIAPDGTGLVTGRTAVDGEERFPAWSPDGTMLAFVSGPLEGGTGDVYVAPWDFSAPVVKISDDLDLELGTPAWSPDGTRLAYGKETGEHEADVFSAGADGSAESNLTSAPGLDFGPDWQPLRFTDIAGSTFVHDILWAAEQGITIGCNPPGNTLFCPGDLVTRGQMAALLVRARGLTEGTGSDRFGDDDGSTFEGDIDRLAAAGITKGCNPPANDRFCPNDPVTRGQMAAFLHRASPYLDG